MKKLLPYFLVLGISSPASAWIVTDSLESINFKTHDNLVLVGKEPVYCVAEETIGQDDVCYLPIGVQDQDDRLDQHTRTTRVPYLLRGS